MSTDKTIPTTLAFRSVLLNSCMPAHYTAKPQFEPPFGHIRLDGNNRSIIFKAMGCDRCYKLNRMFFGSLFITKGMET